MDGALLLSSRAALAVAGTRCSCAMVWSFGPDLDSAFVLTSPSEAVAVAGENINPSTPVPSPAAGIFGRPSSGVLQTLPLSIPAVLSTTLEITTALFAVANVSCRGDAETALAAALTSVIAADAVRGRCCGPDKVGAARRVSESGSELGRGRSWPEKFPMSPLAQTVAAAEIVAEPATFAPSLA